MDAEIELNGKIVCIVGLGYVGLPLAIEFSKHFKTIGFDISQEKIEKLQFNLSSIEITSDPGAINQADFVILAVPTPITNSKEPDLSFVKSASTLVGKNLKKNAIVILESTVYPGVTEEIVAPILEKESGYVLGQDFKIGYSPERVNPGDEEHTIDKISKIVSGMDEATTTILSKLYGSITSVYTAQDIKTAEAAKVIENIQRDLNIALVNELSIIFNKLHLDTKKVLDAASTKWNFIRFYPGLVGGHCLPVDPYYLVYKARELGYHPQVILAGRSVNDYMGKYVAEITVKSLNEIGKTIKGSKILIMGLTYKKNVDDVRESKVKEVIKELKEFKCDIYGFDPLLTLDQIQKFDINAIDTLNGVNVDCVILVVMHDHFTKIGMNHFKEIMRYNPILVDLSGSLEEEAKNHSIIYRTL